MTGEKECREAPQEKEILLPYLPGDVKEGQSFPRAWLRCDDIARDTGCEGGI